MALKQITVQGLTGKKQRFTPSKIVCIGRNYVEHIQELGNEVPDDMVVFIKPNSAISTQLTAFHQETVHYEAELCFMVNNGKLSAVGLGLDLTKRSLQNTLKTKGLPWERAKAFDGSALFSDFIDLDALGDSNSARVSDNSTKADNLAWCFEFEIDGVIVQWGYSELMMYSPQLIIDALTDFVSLEEGDIIMTGTPKGVGALKAGSHYQLSLWQARSGQDAQSARDEIKIGPRLISKQWLAV
jgi:2-keto-4-pentenoate hydratase/2-oxohepta-3-ene-1,7-dioic acid hydratase in catechol pathway